MQKHPHWIDLDRRLVAAARGVHLLGGISWPVSVTSEFLSAYRSGEARLPSPPPVLPIAPDRVAALTSVAESPDLDRGHPAGAFLGATVDSYLTASRLLESAGTPEGLEASRQLFGCPSDPMPGSSMSHADAAAALLDRTRPLVDATRDDESDYCLTAEYVSTRMHERFQDVFGAAAPRVVIDSTLAAKAAASAVRVRVRSGTCFSDNDVDQLIAHEGLVHSATALNGRRQPALTALGLSAPRTTATQEGLATFAELVTGCMDLARLRRLALRVVAVDRAQNGADFIEVFRFFLEQGQTEEESVQSAARIFRGGDVRGRHVFTKDTVYLRGLLAVHAFLRGAIADNRTEVVDRVFAGRLTLGDTTALEPLFEDGTIAPPEFVPEWATRRPRLAAYLAFTNLLHGIRADHRDSGSDVAPGSV